MKELKAIKSPTLHQTLSMARNLREKFDRPALIEVKSWAFSSDTANSVRPMFRLYVANKISENFDDWTSCQSKYFSIMASHASDFPDEVPNE